MATNNFFKTDLFQLHNYVASSAILYPKEIILSTLKDFFSHDHYYRYGKDDFGYANTPQQKGLELNAGLNDNLSTRIFIGENYRFDNIFYPAILVKYGSGRSVPISMSRDFTTVQWEIVEFVDGYGNITLFKRPQFFVTDGAWEGSIQIDVQSRSLRARDDLMDLIINALINITFPSMLKAGIAVKPSLSWGSPVERDDRNDKLFMQTINVEIRNEWRQMIPITSFIEFINLAVDFADLASPNPIIDPNIRIDETFDIIYAMNNFETYPLKKS